MVSVLSELCPESPESCFEYADETDRTAAGFQESKKLVREIKEAAAKEMWTLRQHVAPRTNHLHPQTYSSSSQLLLMTFKAQTKELLVEKMLKLKDETHAVLLIHGPGIHSLHGGQQRGQ